MQSYDLTPVTWRKSSYSGNSGNCVEVAVVESVVRIRDSKDPKRVALRVSPGGWRAFLRGLKK
ncbi:MAG TPA: DUF397 domain-containing protein [Streptosporangiaceae bacterium]|jgi:hypothetical protein